MIGNWAAQSFPFLIALFVVFIPGLLAMFVIGLRGLRLAAFAPIFGVASTGLLAVLLGIVRLPWSALTWALGTAVIVVLAWVVGRLLGRKLPAVPRGRDSWLLIGALGVGMALSVWRLTGYIHDPAGISQTNDDVFHLNAVRYILATSNASSLHVSGVIGANGFYPAAWHGIVSLIVVISGASIPVAANMLTLVIGAVIWPLGITWLARVVSGSAIVAAYAAVLCAALQAFPLLMFQWGVLFPNALSTALIPAGVALVVSLPHLRGDGGMVRDALRGILLVLVTAGAMALAQPASLLPYAAACLVWATFRLLRTPLRVGMRSTVVVIVVAWFACAALWWYLSHGTSGSHWPPFQGKGGAILSVLLNSQVGMPMAVGVSILMLVGLVVAIRQRASRWFVVVWLGASALYVLVASAGRDIFRVDVLGAWYADPYRIASLAPLVVIPLAGLGGDAIVRGAATLLRRGSTRAVSIVGLSGAAVLMVVLILVRPVEMPNFRTGGFDDESRYDTTATSYLNTDERALLERLDEYVEPGARVIGNPSTGMGFGYFFSGVDVYPRTWSPPTGRYWQVLADGLRDAGTDPAVCTALKEYGSPRYVLDFGPGEHEPGRYMMPGMTDFAGQPGFTRVAGSGDASLWRITACGR